MLAASLVAALCVWAAACASGDDMAFNAYQGDASFGRPAQPFQDAATLFDASAGPLDSGPTGAQVRLRVFSGIVNLGPSYLCHDPDYVADRPDTDLDESNPGPATASELALLDGGVVELGGATVYAELAPLLTGALTVHRSPPPDGGSDAGITTDSSVSVDSGGDAAGGDGAVADADAPPARCSIDSLEAVLPLPTPSDWITAQRADRDAGSDGNLDDGGTGDAGANEQRGFIPTALGGDTLTLFGSGFALDAAEVARRQKTQHDAVLLRGGSEAEAQAAAVRLKQLLEASYGPRFLLSRAGAASPDRFALHFSHLIPDVPAIAVGEPAPPDTGSGALHLCMTVGGMEKGDSLNGSQGFAFRNYASVASDLEPALSYRFRMFVQADFPQGSSACATTSLKPVVELVVDAARFQAGGSYTLIAWGAISSDSLCTGATPLVRASCARPSDQLRPRLELIDN